MISKIATTFTLLFLLNSCNSKAQDKKEYTTKIDSLLVTTNPRPFNGVVVITRNDSIIYQKAVGFKNVETQIPLQTDDQFVINSNSKQITAALVLMEVEKGTIDLHAPIHKYLPYLKQDWAKKVTVHQLLNHTHGIKALDKPLSFEPGTNFEYGNLSNILLGKIIAFATKKSYAEMASALFKKLGMTHSFADQKEFSDAIVSGHINDSNKFTVAPKKQANQDAVPAGGIISTAADLSIWNNNLHEGKILKPESYSKMITANVLAQHDAFGKEKTGYGYGIRINELGKIKYIGHTGLGDGYASLSVYFPESKTSLVVLENQTNTNSTLGYYIGIQIKDLILKSQQ